ncbi:MAG: HlyD family efflux transporter periplasmic adaptor subunit [Ruminococcaceae bacterium]|nr:HlyD family efflux transporter periplasmic adaptor subunit [Oscillospiraceae bacterium]
MKLSIKNIFKKAGNKEEIISRYKNMSKKTKRIIALCLAGVILVSVGAVAFIKNKKGDDTAINTAVANMGRVRSVISASGTIQPKDKYEVVSSVRGDVLSDTFEVGDSVKKGDVLYELDKDDMADTLEKAELSMERTRDSYNDTMENVNDLTVKAPISGVISQMFVSEGDSVSNGTKICEIIDKSKMTLTIPFNTSDIGYIGEGFIADVTLQNSFYKTTGVVKRVSTGSLINDLNVAVSYVDIEVENPGGITTSDTATAVINTIACNSAGTFSYAGKKTVSAKVSGDIATIYNDIGDQVYEGSTILVIESDSVKDSMKNANRTLREAQISLDKTYEQLEDYTITAKIDGTIIEKNIKAGDTLDNTNGNTTMCVIADMSVISFTISVDELDVEKIEIDQKVDITADALPNKRFSGHVNSININGATSNGVTTYPVEVIVDNPEGMLPGMNVNAEIVIEEKYNILVVPVSAVMRGNIVYVKEEDAKKNDLEIISQKDNDKNNKTDNKNPNNKTETQKGAGENTKTDSKTMPNSQQTLNSQQTSKGQQTPNAQQTPNSQQSASKDPNNSGNQNRSQMPSNMNIRLGDIPEGFVAVRVTTGINDDDFIEITSGLKEGVTVYVKSTSSSTNNMNMMRMPGGMGGGMPGGMGGMSGGSGARTNSTQNRQRN